MVTPTRVPGVVRLARVLFFANAAILLALALAALARPVEDSQGEQAGTYRIAGLMVVNGAT